jgi:hypothetical protein
MFQTLPGYQVSKQQNDVNDGNLKRLMWRFLLNSSKKR